MLEKIGPYVIEKLIGTGSAGEVYFGRASTGGDRLAIKVCSRGDLDGRMAEQLRRQFETEARIATMLEHPNIVRVLDSGVENDKFYLAMECVANGRTLTRYCRDRECQAHMMTVVQWACQIADALHFAHARGVIHRDVKPANILLGKHWQPKLADFGISTLADPEWSVTCLQRVGSPGYMAPEQLALDETSAQSDIFSLGVVLFSLLTTTHPFAARTAHETMANIVNGRARSLGSLRSDLPRQLHYIVDRSLKRDPRKRYASALDMCGDLSLVLESLKPGARPAA